MEDVSNIVRVGQVSSVNPRNNSCRVAFDDLREPSGKPYVSAEMQVLQHDTVKAKHFSLPEAGEHVLCLFQPNGNQEGFVLGSHYTASNLPEDDDAKTGLYRTRYDDGAAIEHDLNTHVSKISFEDGTVIEYDLNAHTAKVHSEHSVVVEAREVTITASTVRITGQVEISGDVNVSGSITATGSVIDGGSNTNHHTH